MHAARLVLRIGRASSFCLTLALVLAPSIARAEGPYVRLDVGTLIERSAYTRYDATPGSTLFPSAQPFLKRTVLATGFGFPVRVDLGWAIRRDVVLAISLEGSYIEASSTTGDFAGRAPQGWFRMGAGLTSFWRPTAEPRLTVRLGCNYVASSWFGGQDDSFNGPDDTFDFETLRGVDVHAGAGWDLLVSKLAAFGPALRVDLGRLSNGRPNGASTLTTLSASLTLGVTFR